MANDRNEPEGKTDLTEIRELLQRLEAAAASQSSRAERRFDEPPQPPRLNLGLELPMPPSPPPLVRPLAGESRELLSLNRTGSVTRIEPSIPQLEAVPARVDPTEIVVTPQRAQGASTVVAVASFVFGAVAALVLVTQLGDVRRLLGFGPKPDVIAKDGTAVVQAPPPVLPDQGAPGPTAELRSPAPAAAAPRGEAAATPATPEARPVAPATDQQTPGAGGQPGGAASASSAGSNADVAPQPVRVTSGPARLTVAAGIAAPAGDRTPLPVIIEPLPLERERILLVIKGMPEELSLSKGSAIGNEIWLLPAHTAVDLSIVPARSFKGEVPLRLELATADGRILSRATTTVHVMAATPGVIEAVSSASAAVADTETTARLVTRSELLLDTGEIAAARQLLERAARAGSALAALRLGDTYAPARLQQLGGRPPDADEGAARRWYDEARLLGHADAQDRLGELGRR